MKKRDELPERDELKRVFEAILFAHGGPVTSQMLIDAMPGLERPQVKELMAELRGEYDQEGRAFELVRVAGGYQICTRPLWSDWVARFQRGKRRVRLSRAAVETLGIIAYRQPVTRAEIEDVRGVDAGGVVHTLLERNMISVKGRAKGVGRPLLYVTTPEFLEYFGLDSLADMPRLEEIEELLKDRTEIMEEIEAVAGPAPAEQGDAATDEAAIDAVEPDEAAPDEAETNSATDAESGIDDDAPRARQDAEDELDPRTFLVPSSGDGGTQLPPAMITVERGEPGADDKT